MSRPAGFVGDVCRFQRTGAILDRHTEPRSHVIMTSTSKSLDLKTRGNSLCCCWHWNFRAIFVLPQLKYLRVNETQTINEQKSSPLISLSNIKDVSTFLKAMQQLEVFLQCAYKFSCERHPFQTFFIGLPNYVISIIGAVSRVFSKKHVLISNYLRMKRLTNTHGNLFSRSYEYCLNG